MLAQEVEVKNAAGVVVPVKALDIAAGDETAEFEFVTAVKAADLKGVWTVNGQEYDLDLFNNLSDFLDAGNQVELNAALVALEIKNVDADLMPKYFAAKNKLASEVEAEELTVADVQKLVNDVNKKEMSAEEEALVKAIEKAAKAGNEITTLAALEDAGIERVNSDWIDEYINHDDGDTPPVNDGLKVLDYEVNDLEDVQDIINMVNDEEVVAKKEIAGIVKKDLTDYKMLIENYATVNEDGEYVNSTFDTDLEAIEEQLALIEVLEATTPTAFKNKLTALSKLTDDIDLDKYVDANGKEYIRVIKDLNSASPKTIYTDYSLAVGFTVEDTLELQEAIEAINDYEKGALVTAVKTAASGTDANALVTALNKLGVKQVAETNKAEYLAADFSSITGLEDAQAVVDGVNVAEVNNATKATIIAKLNVFGIDNIVTANAEAYVTAGSNVKTVAVGANHKATVAAVKDAVKDDNHDVIVAAQLKAINEAEDVATVKAALDILADIDEVTDYLKIRSVDRDFVAAFVLDKRDADGTPNVTDKKYDNISAVAAQVTAAQGDYSGALTAVNAIEIDSDIDEIVSALEGTRDEAYNDLSNTAKVTAAEAFHSQLTFAEDGTIKTPFVTIAAVKALLK